MNFSGNLSKGAGDTEWTSKLKGKSHDFEMGAQWLSGRALDSRPRDREFEPHRRYCVVVLEQAHLS